MTKHDLVIAELQERINGYQEETRKIVASLEAQIKEVEKQRFNAQRNIWRASKINELDAQKAPRVHASTFATAYRDELDAGEIQAYILHEWASDKYIAEGFDIGRQIVKVDRIAIRGVKLTFADGKSEYVASNTPVEVFKLPLSVVTRVKA
jgi:hypothetical protein